MLDEKKPHFVWAFVGEQPAPGDRGGVRSRKIHVIFEKPLASTYNDALKIQELARKHEIKVM